MSNIDKVIYNGTEYDLTGETLSSVYSTEEQVIGKWIDGKPIYRKVIIFTSSIASNTNVVIAQISDIDEIVNYNYSIRSSNGKIDFLGDNFNGSSTQFLYIEYNYTTGNLSINSVNEDWASPRLKVTLEYTKTTD